MAVHNSDQQADMTYLVEEGSPAISKQMTIWRKVHKVLNVRHFWVMHVKS